MRLTSRPWWWLRTTPRNSTCAPSVSSASSRSSALGSIGSFVSRAVIMVVGYWLLAVGQKPIANRQQLLLPLVRLLFVLVVAFEHRAHQFESLPGEPAAAFAGGLGHLVKRLAGIERFSCLVLDLVDPARFGRLWRR